MAQSVSKLLVIPSIWTHHANGGTEASLEETYREGAREYTHDAMLRRTKNHQNLFNFSLFSFSIQTLIHLYDAYA